MAVRILLSIGLWLSLMGLHLPQQVRGGERAAAKPAVERVSFTPRSDGGGYVVRLHTSGLVHAYSEPERLDDGGVELTLFNVERSATLQTDAPQGPVREYGVRSNGSRLVLTFALHPEIPVESSVYRDRNSTDLLLALNYAGDTGPVLATPADVETVQPGEAARTGERWRLDTVVIDAGHGGKDVGALGAGGVREKDIVLGVALKLGAYLEDLLGVNVVYTRDDDRFIPLKDRGRIANEAGGKLFVSIHANSAGSASAHGTETFFLGMHKTAAAHNVMERENEVIKYEADQEHYARFDDPSLLVRQELAQSAYMRKSESLAGLIEEQFAERVQRRSRGVKQAGFYVLWSASMPSVLVELGFLTNPREAAFLRSKDGQTYMASAIFRAIRAYKEQYERDLHLSAAD